MKRSVRFLGLPLAAVVALIVAMGVLPAGLMASAAGPTTVSLGAAASYAVFAAASITASATTTINGDLGLDPGTSAGSPTVNGTSNVHNAASLSARTLLKAAYIDAAGRTGATTVAGDTLGGKTFFAGVYSGGALDLPTTAPTVTLDAQGDATAVFIFQAASTLVTAASTTVSLTNGAQACNVFWQVGSSATLGASSMFRGTILAHTTIAVGTSATVLDGRLLAGVGASTDSPSSDTGALTMLTNTVTKPTCAAVPTPTPAPTATPAPAGPPTTAPAVCCSSGTTPAPATPGPLVGTTPLPAATATPTPVLAVAPTATPTAAPTASPTPGTPLSLPSTNTREGDSSLILIPALSVIALVMFWLWARRRDPDPAV